MGMGFWKMVEFDNESCVRVGVQKKMELMIIKAGSNGQIFMIVFLVVLLAVLIMLIFYT